MIGTLEFPKMEPLHLRIVIVVIGLEKDADPEISAAQIPSQDEWGG